MANIIKELNKSSNDVIEFALNLSVEELEKAILYSADKYYNTSESVISDEIYDILIDFLKLKDPKSKILKNVGAKIKSKNKVKLDYWLGSMDKIKPPSNQLNIWTKKYIPPYNLSDKLDGISALLIYNNNKINMYTRGTANEGLDITHLIKYLRLPDYEKVHKYCKKHGIKGNKNMIALRGELIMKESVFNNKWSLTLKNGRNSVAGLVNSKTINPELAMDTELILYEIIDPFYDIQTQLDIIKDMGFNCVNYKVINNIDYDLLSNYLKDRRKNSEYQIDGIIVTSMKNQTRNIDGNPEYAFAFKDVLEDQIGVTIVEGIEWNISKDGLIKPTILLKPITIGGVEIKRTSGFNAKFIVDNNIGIGTQVEIIRSGDVIPYIKRVIKSTKAEMPKERWEWNESKVDIKIENIKTNNKVLIKNIYHFFSTIGTKGLGEKIVEKLVDAGFNSVIDIIKAKENDLLKVEGFKDKSVKNLMESIEKSLQNISLSKIMAGSNKLGSGLGEERFKQILGKYPNILSEYKKWTKKEFIERIKELNGWEEKTSTLLVSNFDEFIDFYNTIKKYIVLEIKEVTEGYFTNKTVVLTGFRDKTLQDKIESQNGKIGNSVTKTTDFLVVKDQSVIDEGTTKITKAQELGIKIITKEKLIKLLN